MLRSDIFMHTKKLFGVFIALVESSVVFTTQYFFCSYFVSSVCYTMDAFTATE